jgi:hypothetical protein
MKGKHLQCLIIQFCAQIWWLALNEQDFLIIACQGALPWLFQSFLWLLNLSLLIYKKEIIIYILIIVRIRNNSPK